MSDETSGNTKEEEEMSWTQFGLLVGGIIAAIIICVLAFIYGFPLFAEWLSRFDNPQGGGGMMDDLSEGGSMSDTSSVGY
jgi:hypothetical protein